MFCHKCGQPIATGIQYCPGCGTDVSSQTAAAKPRESAPQPSAAPAASPPPTTTAAGTTVAPPPPSGQYASFGLRLGAALIDGAINWVVGLIVQIPLGLGMGLSDFRGEEDILAILGLFSIAIVFSFGFNWLYEALLTSSSWQATVGKKALGIIVTDENGARISFLRATGRHFGKLISGLVLMIGYLIQPFTPKRQALHDILAGTLVIKP